MSYITLEDDTGTMELLAFQRVLDEGGGYVKENAPLLVRGRISLRDEKEAQIMADSIRPLTDLDIPGGRDPKEEPGSAGKKLYVRLPSEQDPIRRRIELLLTMFPGSDRIILYFEDTKKRVGAPCLLHESLLAELRELLGEENVVVK
jgi:DNA polymerase-3 subunit alpha